MQTRKLLFDGGRKATVSFYVRGVAPVDVAVDVVRASDRTAVAHFAVPAVAPRAPCRASTGTGPSPASPQPPTAATSSRSRPRSQGGAGVRAAQVSAPPRAGRAC